MRLQPNANRNLPPCATLSPSRISRRRRGDACACVPAPAPNLAAVPQSADLKRILVEVVEVELEKQRKANASLATREAALRARLETAKPRSIEARTAEEEINGQALSAMT